MSTPPTRPRSRSKIPISLQVRVFYRDGWLCRWCYRPTIFSPTLRLLQLYVQRSGYNGPLAYFHPRWRRDSAPLLDHLGAVIDHVESFAGGGLHEERNFATACNKCNARKNSRVAEKFIADRPRQRVRGKFGEPTHWDGLASLFLVLASAEAELPASERVWLREIKAFTDAGSTRPAPVRG